MSLHNWLSEGRLRRHESSPSEIKDLLRLVDRDLADASLGALSLDRRFAIAYNAVLQLATVALRSSGYRASRSGHHWITFQVLPMILGDDARERADYFDSCRRKRNLADYDAAGEIGDAEVRELMEEALAFRADLFEWLLRNHPTLFPK